MNDTALAPLTAWDNFYVIVGSSAAALTGLQFVVIALIAEIRSRSAGETVSAFGTPTVVHFCVALLVSATLSAPWGSALAVAVALAITGLGGLAYSAIVIRRTRRQTGYTPVFEDWLFHAALPVVAYAMVLAGGLTLPIRMGGALFAVAAAVLLLVFIGIHNAWDTVTYVTFNRERIEAAAGAEPKT